MLPWKPFFLDCSDLLVLEELVFDFDQDVFFLSEDTAALHLDDPDSDSVLIAADMVSARS